MKWFRWHRATVERSKFRIIAARASKSGMGGGPIHPDRVDGAVFLTDVIAIWAFILEDAANQDNWGYYSRDCHATSVTLDLGYEEVTQVIKEMVVEDMLEWSEERRAFHIVNWEKYQYISDSKDPTAAERQRKRRERIRGVTVTRDDTQTLRPDTDTDTDTDIPPNPQGEKVEVVDDPAFTALWSVWKPFDMPKGNKQPAAKAFVKAKKLSPPEKIIAGAKAYCADCAKRQSKTKHVSSWLNNQGWLDDYAKPQEAKNGYFGM